MAYIYAGTAYNQIVSFSTIDKSKNKTLYGPMDRQIVNHITVNFDQNEFYYSTSKHINIVHENQENKQTSTIVSALKDQKIIYIDYDYDFNNLRYALSNGAIKAFGSRQGEQKSQSIVLFKGDSPNRYLGAKESQNKEQYLFYGKGILPYIANLPNGLVSWKGKNVKHDELDLQVPINDVDASFIRDQKFHAILNANNKLRIYDIRGTNRRPCSDISLKVTQKANMTRMVISNNKNYYYFSNDIGEIFESDSRKDWNIVGKFKGITTTVTDMAVSDKQLVTSSLDSYVRIFSVEQKKQINKFYMNKPIYSLFVLFSEEEEQSQNAEKFNEEQIDLAEEQQGEKKRSTKIKQIRKRNKVGLKYLQPRQFDDVEVKQEEIKKQEWYQKLNPIDRRDFQEQA